MNELSKEKTMTVQEVASILNVSGRTIQRHIKDICPEKVENGKRIYLNEKEVTLIKLRIERSGRNDLDNVVELPKTHLEKELIIQQALMFQQEKIIFLQKENEVLKPKAEYTDRVLLTDDLLTITQIASDLNMTANKLNKILSEKNIIYKVNNQWIIKEKYKNEGYVKSKTHIYIDNDNKEHSSLHTYWTQKGRHFIYDVLAL